MGNLIVCYRTSDQKKGTSVKTLLRRTEKPSKKRKHIDDLVADALKREERDERQKRKREKKCTKKQSEDLQRKEASGNDDDVLIQQKIITNNDNVKQNAVEDAAYISNNTHTESSEATSADESVVKDTAGYLLKTDERPTDNNTEGYLLNTDDRPTDTNTEGYLPNTDDRPTDTNTDGYLPNTDDRPTNTNTEWYLPKTDDRPTDTNTEGYLPKTDDRPTDTNTEGYLPKTVDKPTETNSEGYLPNTDDRPTDTDTEGYLPKTDERPTDTNTKWYIPKTDDKPTDTNTEGYLPNTDDRPTDTNTEGFLPKTDDKPTDTNTEGYLPNTDDKPSDTNTEGYLPNTDDKPTDINTEGYLLKTDDKPTDTNTEGYLPKTDDKPTDTNTEGYLLKTDDKPTDTNTEGYLPKTDDKPTDTNTEGNLLKTDDKPTDINTEGYISKTDDKPTDITTEGYISKTDDKSTDINTEGYISKTDDTDIYGAAEHEAKEPDLCETSDQQTIPNILLLDTELDHTELTCDVIEYPQASIYDIDNNNKTKEKCLCPENTNGTTDDGTTNKETENLNAESLTTDEMVTTDSLDEIETNTSQDCHGLQRTNIKDISKYDNKETYSVDSETNNVKEVNADDAQMNKSKERTGETQHLESPNTAREDYEDIHTSTIDTQNGTEVNTKLVEISETKESIDKEVTINNEQLDSHRTAAERNDDKNNTTVDSQALTKLNDNDVEVNDTKEWKVVEISVTKESTEKEQLHSHKTTKEDVHISTLASQDKTAVNDASLEIIETKVSIYDENCVAVRTTTDENGECECKTTDRTAGNNENMFNKEQINTSDTCKDAIEDVHNDNSLPCKGENTDKSEECEDGKNSSKCISLKTNNTDKDETKFDLKQENGNITTDESKVICSESNLVNDGEHADVLARKEKNDRESMRQNDPVCNERVSNDLFAERNSLSDSKHIPWEIEDVNMKQDHEICSDTRDKDSLKANENEDLEFPVHDVTSGVELQSKTSLTRSDTNTCQVILTNIGDTSKNGHDCKDNSEQIHHDVETVSDNKRAELIPRSKSIPIRQCVALVTGFAKELKQTNGIPKQRDKLNSSRTERFLNKAKSIILKRPMPKGAVFNKAKSWHGRRSPVHKRLYPGSALQTMNCIGKKPQLKAIERLKNDPLNYENRRKILTEQDRHGSIEELKWSRHMRKGIRLGVMRENVAIENKKYKVIAAIGNCRYNSYNHSPPVLKPTITNKPSHISSTSRIKPATIQSLRDRYSLGKNQSPNRCVSPSRSDNDPRFSTLSRISSTDDINHITELSNGSKKKVPFRTITRKMDKACKVKAKTKSNGSDRQATPSANNTEYVGIGRQTSFMNLGMDRCRKDF